MIPPGKLSWSVHRPRLSLDETILKMVALERCELEPPDIDITLADGIVYLRRLAEVKELGDV